MRTFCLKLVHVWLMAIFPKAKRTIIVLEYGERRHVSENLPGRIEGYAEGWQSDKWDGGGAWAICPCCLVERADYEGPYGQWLPRCPNCGNTRDPVVREGRF